MSRNVLISLGVLGILGIILIISIIMYFSISNSEIQLRQQITAQQQKNTAVFDEMWKVISQQAGVADQYKTAFKDIFPELIAGRYKSGGELMKWIQEQNPTFDTKLYDKLMTTITGQRKMFTANQEVLIDLQRQHSTMLKTFPNSVFIGSRPEIKITIITSTRTDETFKSGKDDDINLFNK